MKYFVFYFIFSVTSSTTLACKCMETTFKDGFSNSKIIFIGKVLNIKDFRESCQNDFCSEYQVEFKIDRILKGNCENQIIHTFKDSGGCGYPFRQSEKYLVYADSSGVKSYRVVLCSRTAKLDSENAQSDIKRIEKN